MRDELQQLDFVFTNDADGKRNGWVTGVCKEDGKLLAYQTLVYPSNDPKTPVVKGFHCYRRQTNRLTCVSGFVDIVVYWDKKRKVTYKLAEHTPVCLVIPPEHPFAIMNYSPEFSRVMNHPQPLWDLENFKTDQYAWEPTEKLKSQNGEVIDLQEFAHAG